MILKKNLAQTHHGTCTEMTTADSYYTINRYLLLIIGLWPYQNFGFRIIVITFLTIILTSGVIFQFTTFVTKEYSTDLLLKILAYSMPWITHLLRYNILCLNAKKTQGLIERVRIDWSELNNARELEIIKKYSAFGKLITLVSTWIINLGIFSVIVMTILVNYVLNVPTSANESRQRQFPAEIECFVDQQKYFAPLLLYIFFVVWSSLTVLIASEALFMSYTQHACGLFEIANCRIEQTLHRSMPRNLTSVAEKNAIICQGIISAIDIHKKAIEFIEMLKENFKWVFFTALPLTVLSLSINLYRLSRQVTSDEHHETITTLLFATGQFGYLFFCNYLGQEVIDHSGDIFHKTYNIQWYMAPLKAQKLLLLVMQRSLRYCTITIGGLFIPSLEGFASLSSMSLSYFMVIYSVQ